MDSRTTTVLRPTSGPGRERTRTRVVVAVVALVVLVLLGIVMTHSARWHAAELRVDQAAVDHAPHWVTAVSTLIADTFQPGGATTIIVVLAAITWIVRRRFSVVLTYLAFTVVPWLASEALKLIVERPRPAVHGVAPISTPWTWSYPSGHAAVATALVIGALFLLGPVLRPRPVLRRLAIAAGVVLVAVVAVSRVVLAVHYPTDVVAGPLCALAFAALVDAVVRTIQRRRAERDDRIMTQR